MKRAEMEALLADASARETLESAFLIALASWDGKGPVTFSVKAHGAEAIAEMERAIDGHARRVRAQQPEPRAAWRDRRARER